MKVKNNSKKYLRRAGHLFRPNEIKEINLDINSYKAKEIKYCSSLQIIEPIIEEAIEEAIEEDNDLVNCPICDKEYKSAGLTRHINSAHPEYSQE